MPTINQLIRKPRKSKVKKSNSPALQTKLNSLKNKLMLIVSYDFEDNKTRAKFARFLEKYGHRIQYSVWQVRDSQRVLQNILTEVSPSKKSN